MLARRASPASTTVPPQSPSLSAAILRGNNQIHNSDSHFTEAPGASHITSPPHSPWESPSPTQTLGHSSPELPSLPALRSIGSAPHTPLARAQRPKADNEAFYTASWGSPYDRPPSESRNGQDRQRSASSNFGSDDSRHDESSLQFSLSHLLPSLVPENESPEPHFGLGHLIPSRVPDFEPATPTAAGSNSPGRETTPRPFGRSAGQLDFREALGDKAESLLQQVLASKWNSEKASWWSDDEASASDKEVRGVVDRDVSGLQFDSSKKGHRPRRDNLTLKQDDFWAHFSRGQKDTLAKMMASRYADPPQPKAEDKVSTSSDVGGGVNREKPLPPAPASITPAAELRADSVQSASPIDPKTAESRSSTPSHRVKKKVPTKKGRTILVDLPPDIVRGKSGHPPRPLSSSEVAARLQLFQQAGYDTRGFGHWRDHGQVTIEQHAQNRALYPDVDDYQEERKARKIGVRIPKKAEWDAYLQYVTEQKLAALGVSLGGDDEPTSSNMSRQNSSQYASLPFSPPPQSTSSNSQRMMQPGSVTFPRGTSPGHIPTRSIASPTSSFAPSRGSSHMHRHSTFASPTGFAPQPTPPGLSSWSPQQHLGSQHGLARGGSPGLAVGRPDMADTVSPRSPFSDQYAQNAELLNQMHQQQQALQAQLMQQQQQQLLNARPSSTLADVIEDEAEAEEDDVMRPRNTVQSQAQIAVPTPRGHRHNISANLERDVENADYHLERAIDKQLSDEGEFSAGAYDNKPAQPPQSEREMNGAAPELVQQNSQVLHHPQPHNRAHSLTQPQNQKDSSFDAQYSNFKDLSDDEQTNPILEGAEGESESIAHSKTPSFAANTLNPHSKHSSKSSISKLNVDAKEFKFNPTASFSPSNFSRGGFNFHPAKAKSFKPLARDDKPTFPGLGSGLNVAAPSFTPSGLEHSKVTGKSTVPSGEFNFFSSGPSFKPDAPAFVPSLNSSVGSDAGAPPISNGPAKIFGNFDYNAQDVVKPARRTKAVPIIRPDIQQYASDENMEDEAGRPMQSDARLKRMRRVGADGEQVPQFAMPTHPLGEMTASQANKRSELERTPTPMPEEKENHAPEQDENGQKTTPVQQASVKRGRDGEHGEANEETVEELDPSKKQGSLSSLSASAKPFEFRPRAGLDGSFETHTAQRPAEKMSDAVEKLVPAPEYRLSEDAYLEKSPEPREAPSMLFGEDSGFQSQSMKQPSFNEIDEVMKQMNDGSDFGIERDDVSWDEDSAAPATPPQFSRLDMRPATLFRSDAPSPSPNRLIPTASPGRHGGEISEVTQDPFSDGHAGIAYESPVHQLNKAEDVPISDWDDAVSSAEDVKLQSRLHFFDNHVDVLIGNLLQSRLGPLESSIRNFQNEIVSSLRTRGRSNRRSLSGGRVDSDADDEDEEFGNDSQYRARSPRKDRKLEKMRQIVNEALSSHEAAQAQKATVAEKQPPINMTEFYQAFADMKVSLIQAVSSGISQPASTPQPIQPDMAEFFSALADLKASLAQTASTTIHLEEYRGVVQDALQQHGAALAVAESGTSSAKEKEGESRIAELEGLLKETRERLDEESSAREAEAEAREKIALREEKTQKMLTLAEEEISLFKQQSREDGNRMRAMEDEILAGKMKISGHENATDHLSERLLLITKANESLEDTVQEYRMSSEKWRLDIEAERAENEKLNNTITGLKFQIDEAVRIRETMRAKLEKLQTDMVEAVDTVSKEKDEWAEADQEHRKRYEVLSARIEAEARTRERLERELERLEAQEREGMRLKIALEQAQQANIRLEEQVATLTVESREHERTAERYEREFREAREAARVEIQRTRNAMESDIDAANNHVNVVRAELEAENARTRSGLDSVRMDMDTMRAKHELMLEEASDTKAHALEAAVEERKAALSHQEEAHERLVESLKREHHRALQISHEDKDRSESLLNDKLGLANEKLDYLQDKVLHLEDKLQVAKSAAQAAAQAAQNAKASSTAPSVASAVQSGSIEKVSVQALRESIAVLQEQLQERELHIESLEQEIGSVDIEAPAKLKERDTEIGWLRELLGVRADDLTDLVNTLAEPEYDPEAVRNAAIRIRANLQMEQQEKERLISGGGQNFPTLASISNFASPKAVQLAAAIGNWRNRGKDGNGAPALDAASRAQTPARASPAASAHSFLSGLMTPPASHARRTPSHHPQQAQSSRGARLRPRRADSGGTSLSALSVTSPRAHLSARQLGKRPLPMPLRQVRAPPRMPPLLRTGSYDRDAEDGQFSAAGFYDDDEEEDEDEDGLGGEEGVGEKAGPFGPGLSA